jgi:ribosomal protein L40E
MCPNCEFERPRSINNSKILTPNNTLNEGRWSPRAGSGRRFTPMSYNARIVPGEYLNSTERVIFETRPSFVAIVGLSMIAWLIVGSIITFILIEVFSSSLFLLTWLLLVILPFILQVLSWAKRFYALTNQRLLEGEGFLGRGFRAFNLARTGGALDLSTYRITGVAFDQGIPGRLFGFGTIIFDSNHGPIKWKGLKDALNVRRVIEEKVAFLQSAQHLTNVFAEETAKISAQIRSDQGYFTKNELAQSIKSENDPNLIDSIQMRKRVSQFGICNSCGAQNTYKASYCSQCGCSLEKPS